MGVWRYNKVMKEQAMVMLYLKNYKKTINSKCSVRELQRQRDSLLYERLVLSADKEKILELSEKGQIEKSKLWIKLN